VKNGQPRWHQFFYTTGVVVRYSPSVPNVMY
jgi:hypothetical protein